MSHESVSFFDRLADELQEQGYEATFIPQNEVAVEGGTDSAQSSQYYSDILSHEPTNSLKVLTEKYDIPSPRAIIFPQMNYDYPFSDPVGVAEDNSAPRYAPPLGGPDKPDYGPYTDWLHRCLDFLDGLYESGAGGMPLQYQGSEVLRLAIEKVAEYHGYPSVWAGFTPIPGYTGFFANSSSEWPTLNNVDYTELTDEEVTRAKEYIETVRQKKPTVKPPGGGDETRVINQILNRVRHQGSITTEGHSLRHRLGRRTRRTLREKYATWKYPSMEKSAKIVKDQEYVFYPLQYYMESRVTMRAPAFYEQAWLIEYLSRSVPTNHELVTKDHPQQLGAQSKRAVDIISNYSAALHPEFHAHDAIRNASVVVTLNNTVGYEALLYGKPVVALGDAFYEAYTYSVSDINDLDSVLSKALHDGGPNREEQIEFVHGIIEGSYEGMWRDESPEVIDSLTTGIIQTAELQ